MKTYFIVSHVNDYGHDIDAAICETFAESKEVIKTTSDWYSNTGSGNVREVEKNCKIIQYWKFKNNQIIDHVRWD